MPAIRGPESPGDARRRLVSNRSAPIPRRDPDRSGSIRRSHPRRGFPAARPVLEVGTASGFPARWNPPPIFRHRIPGARRLGPEPGAVRPVDPPAPGSRPGGRVLSGPLLRPRPGPYRLAPYRSSRFRKRCSPRTVVIMGPEIGCVNPKREIPSRILRIGEKSPPNHGFSTPCPHPDVLVGITRRPASGPARQSSGGGRQPCSTITRRPASSLDRSSPGAATRGGRS